MKKSKKVLLDRLQLDEHTHNDLTLENLCEILAGLGANALKGDDVRYSIEVDDLGYGSESYRTYYIEAYYYRSETDEEEAERERYCAGIALEEERRQRAVYERLRGKFEDDKLSRQT